MTRFILAHPRYEKYHKVIVFANTGKEREETLEFVHECDKRWNLGLVWLEALINPEKGKGNSFKVVDFKTASRDGEPFEAMIAKYGIPNIARPFCTRELKLNPIKKYMQSLGLKQWTTAIGIRHDERHRINRLTAEKEHKIYPLADDVLCTKGFVRTWWNRQSFDLRLKDYEGNCDMCYKKSERKLLTLIKEKPDLIRWWDSMEREYEKGDYSFYRNHQTAEDLIAKAAKGNFRVVNDQEGKWEFDPELDVEFACSCKSS